MMSAVVGPGRSDSRIAISIRTALTWIRSATGCAISHPFSLRAQATGAGAGAGTPHFRPRARRCKPAHPRDVKSSARSSNPVTPAGYPELFVPTPLWNLTRPRVLTMELVAGTKATDLSGVRHPGNLLVSDDGRLVLLDLALGRGIVVSALLRDRRTKPQEQHGPR